MQIPKQEIILNLKKAVQDLLGQETEPQLEHPVDESHGDYSTNIALMLWSNKELIIKNQEYKNPLGLAQKIVDSIIHNSQFMIHFDRVEAVAPGFVNFWVSKNYLVNNLQEVLNKKEYGSKPQDPNKKVVVEYSSPNIAKPFTVGHLRSTIIGDAVANLLDANGWKVYRDNHLGDWGTQFGKQIYAIKKWGDKEKIEKSERPIKELVELYIKFHEEAEKNPEIEDEARKWFKKLEDGDVEARRLWKKCVEWSLKEFEEIYRKLGISFTENNGLGYGESFFEDKIKDVLDELNNKKLLKESEGAKLIFFPQAKFPPLMIIKKDGASLYSTRDLATDKFRLEKYGKDIVVVNEVGAEQTLYFKQLFEVEKMLGWYKEGQRIHLKHGHYRFKDQKMSTRKGNVIWLEDVFKEAEKRALALAGEEQGGADEAAVGIGAIKWNDLKRSSNLDIVFDWDEILNMEGNSGPYLQYTFARTRSVLAKVKNQKSKIKTTTQNSKLENEEVSLLRSLNKFEEIVEEAGEKFAPNILCTYLFDLAQKFNLFYQKHRIVKSENEEFRLALTQAVGQVIKNGLNLLGIPAPEKM